MRKASALLLLLSFLALVAPAQATTLAVTGYTGDDSTPIFANALQDFKMLLDSACHCLQASASAANVEIEIMAPRAGAEKETTDFAQGRNFPYYHYPQHDFAWLSQLRADGAQVHVLHAPTQQGLANGLYALLQERLGFKFVHARQTIVPQIVHWPLQGNTRFEGKPKFDKKGFHLHTMHPLELTEALHDPDFPGGLAMVQEYLLWLARNGQNYFEFSLMEGVDADLEAWSKHAAKITSYAHARGILCGIDLSIHMVQQKSFQLAQFPPGDFRSFEKQIHKRLENIMLAHWDFVNLEFALAEFVGGLEGLRDRLRDAVIAEMQHYPQTKLIGRQHVVKPEDEVGGSHGSQSLNIPADPRMGVLVHTVMCYALTDARAPVYELENFSHLHQLLIAQNQQRETWFYPESAYWVTFDNSIPLLLLPYLNARYKDIQTVAGLGVPGHVTFSSGWEWGYWLVDWSIARWSWNYTQTRDGQAVALPSGPYQYLSEFFPNPAARETMTTMADLQQSWLIEGDLLRWLCPSNPTDELPGPMNKQFQPRGFVNLGDLGKAAKKYPERMADLPIDSLEAYSKKIEELVAGMVPSDGIFKQGAIAVQLAQELIAALRVTALRADHSRALMLAAQARADLSQSHKQRAANFDRQLKAAAEIRSQALEIVQAQERRYRYPLPQLAGRYKSHTAYDFGYLYTVHNLHFWEREEQQMRKGRHGPFFKNIYDLAKIAGLRN